jgi:hypothetical protein
MLFKVSFVNSLCSVDDMPMSRIVRHLLFTSVLVYHTVVALCGPCLHALAGSSHEMGSDSKSQRPDGPLQSGRDSADNCLVCHFVAQGQLPVEFTFTPSFQQVTELVAPTLPVSTTLSLDLPSSPRAPPVAIMSLA